MRNRRRIAGALVLVAVSAVAAGCRRGANEGPPRASGYVEATEVRAAAEVGGRIVDMRVDEGARVSQGDLIAQLDTADTALTLKRLQAERDQAVAQLRLLQAGSRAEDVRQARAQADSASADVAAANAELKSANEDLERFEALLRSNSGSRKQRDDAATRKEVAQARVTAAQGRAQAATENVARLKAGARAEEIAGAQARVSTVEAQIAAIEKSLGDATVKSPVGGVVTSKLVDAGEMVAARTPLVVITDLDHAWANLYVDEPLVPSLRLGQSVSLVADNGQQLAGTITYISPKAEFTPRNVQTAEERSKLVYRIKVTADNKSGLLKPGMPVEGVLQ